MSHFVDQCIQHLELVRNTLCIKPTLHERNYPAENWQKRTCRLLLATAYCRQCASIMLAKSVPRRFISNP